MKKTIKQFVSFLMIIFLLAPNYVFAAQDGYNSRVIFQLTDEEIEAEHLRQIEESVLLMPEGRNDRPQVNNVLGRIETQTLTVRAGGQDRDGHRFNTFGGGFSWNSGGNPISFSLRASWGPVSVSINSGSAVTAQGGIGGIFEPVPRNLLGVNVHLYVENRVEMRETRVYRRMNNNQPWQYSHTTTSSVVVARSLIFQRA